ncbi:MULTISPECIES: hypothetical protein [unclassified Crossiella]|uniref:hypothetical protein n=1 Tax=unclassified Crossiella TaxID=2620835 RepID=UPI001FFF0C26|nr:MULTISPECIES: hypothetical protein [unclassified Crossiella]MCK2237593.1 hypothetical protein [Crossiella sp. S99.2]MCK2254879.1 hypothetical protein [Crossiella sp. S99.1]
MRVRAQLGVAGLLVLLGVLVIAAPLDGPMVVEGTLIEFGPHRPIPTAIDLAGLAVCAAGLAWLLVLLIRYLPAIRRCLGERTVFSAGLVAGFGFGLLLCATATGLPGWWIVGGALVGTVLVVLSISLALRAPD